MSVDPLSFDFELAEFDLSLLPVHAEWLRSDKALLKSTVERHLGEVFKRLPGKLRITPHEERISVTWVPKTEGEVHLMMDLATGLIQKRALCPAEVVLRALLSRYPDNQRVLFSLGILLCEAGRLKEALGVLKTLTRTAPDFAEGWNALGVALSREGKRKEAAQAFERSLSLDPHNGYTLRNLGALMGRKDPQKALAYLKRAARLLPSDQSAQYVYGTCLLDRGKPDDADLVLKKAISLNEHSEIADLCREARIRIARNQVKGVVPRGLRTDVVVHCLMALEKFKELGRERTRAVAFEIASLASGGLNIKDRASRYPLRGLPGEFSALQLVVTMYVGFRKVAPQTDPGIDFSREYAFARLLLKGRRGKSRK